jgi:hypothetical protein
VSVYGPIAQGAVSHSDDVSRGGQYGRGIDYDAEGRILGYEFLNVSRGVDLSGLPHRGELAVLFERVRGIRVFTASSNRD